MATGATFWNLMAKRYSMSPIADQESYEKKLAITRKYLDQQSEVMEFGCGTGSTALLHAPWVKSLLAIDYSSKMIDIANEKKRREGITNVRFEVGDIDSMELEPEQFDAILGLNILHLLPAWEQVLEKVYALLKPGGHFISSSGCLQGRLRLMRGIFATLGVFGGLPKIAAFSEDEFLARHASIGFTLVERLEQPGAPFLFLVAGKPD